MTTHRFPECSATLPLDTRPDPPRLYPRARARSTGACRHEPRKSGSGPYQTVRLLHTGASVVEGRDRRSHTASFGLVRRLAGGSDCSRRRGRSRLPGPQPRRGICVSKMGWLPRGGHALPRCPGGDWSIRARPGTVRWSEDDCVRTRVEVVRPILRPRGNSREWLCRTSTARPQPSTRPVRIRCNKILATTISFATAEAAADHARGPWCEGGTRSRSIRAQTFRPNLALRAVPDRRATRARDCPSRSRSVRHEVTAGVRASVQRGRRRRLVSPPRRPNTSSIRRDKPQTS